MSEEQTLWGIDAEVLQFVEANGDPTLRGIKLGCEGMTQHTAEACVKKLVRGGWLFMKEDPVEHEWTYRRTRKPANTLDLDKFRAAIEASEEEPKT